MAVSDIVISPATVYNAPVGEALPNANTIQFGQVWGGNWVNVGYTLTPVSLQYEQDLFELEVEQITLPVKRLRNKENVTIETTLAELMLSNLNLALDGTITTTAASATARGLETLEAGGRTDLSERAWGFEGLFKKDGSILLPVRVFFFRANAQLNGKLEFSKKAAVGIPLQIKALADTSKAVGKQLMMIQRVTAKMTGEV
jgi:hypothetical protein